MPSSDNEPLAVDLLASRSLETRYGRWDEHLFRYANSDVIVLCHGDWKSRPDVLLRVHSTCFAAHYLESVECDCREQSHLAFDQISAEGAGILVFLDQDGRGNGHAAIMRAAVRASRDNSTQSEAYKSLGYPADARSFDAAAVTLRVLGVKSVRLLTNNPAKLASLVGHGISVTTTSVVVPELASTYLNGYYRKKIVEGYAIDSLPDGEP